MTTHAAIDWTRFEPGAAEFDPRYTTSARQILFVQTVRDLCRPVAPASLTWNKLAEMAQWFGLPGPRETPGTEYLDYLDLCLDTWDAALEHRHGTQPNFLPQ